MPRLVRNPAIRSGVDAVIASAMRVIASSHDSGVKRSSPARRTIGWGMRPRSRSASPFIRRSSPTSGMSAESKAPMVFSRSRRRRMLHRWMPSRVQSERPAVPRAQPSQHPCVRMRMA